MRRIFYFLIALVLLVSTFPVFSVTELTLKEKWEHNDEILEKVFKSYVDSDGDVLICVYREGMRLITPKKVTKFATFGQGNNQVAHLMALDGYPNPKKDENPRIAIIERMDRMKIFEKKEGTYVETGVKWYKRSQYPHFIKNMTFLDKKWFITGRCLLNYDPRITKQAFIRVLNDDGKQIAVLLYEELKTEDDKKGFYIDYFVIANRLRKELYFMSECELKIDIISPVELKVKRSVKLEKPKNYKPMPSHFYDRIKEPKPSTILKNIETWKTSYSRIAKVAVYHDYLVLQLVNSEGNGKNYTLLFYKGQDFKLEKVIPIDDYFLGVHGDNLYFFAGGNPGYNEEVDKVGINIYILTEKK